MNDFYHAEKKDSLNMVEFVHELFLLSWHVDCINKAYRVRVMVSRITNFPNHFITPTNPLGDSPNPSRVPALEDADVKRWAGGAGSITNINGGCDMRTDNRFEDIDKAALHNALLNLHTCPNCRRNLQPVALFEDVWGCASCKETWHLPKEE